MRYFYTLCFILIISLPVFSQTDWEYKRTIPFSSADSLFAQPYLCAVDANGRLYVASSKVTRAAAHNAIYYADANSPEMKLLIDFDRNGDSDTLLGNIGQIRGIAILNTDVYVIASLPYPRTKPNTVACTYIYPHADTNLVQKFGFGITGSGYGTYINGAAITRDSIMFTGIPFQTTIRFYNFSYGITSPARGSYVPIASGTGPTEPGGPNTSGMDVIRDVATIPNADYSNPETPFYTSRNSYSSTQTTGGIACWVGGDQRTPGSYTGTRVAELGNQLVFDKSIPYGITIDKDSLLWVTGTDSTRRWVQGYKILFNSAFKKSYLPSQNASQDPDPLGAPLRTPSDVAFDKEGVYGYVADGGAGAIFQFKNKAVSVEASKTKAFNFKLNQNYPNPFNPHTFISFDVPRALNVKLIVTNALGQTVATLFDGHANEGNHRVSFNGSSLCSGVYFYTLITPENRITKKMSLLK